MKEPTKIAISVSYTVLTAKWRPTYDIVVNLFDGRMKLSCRPAMHQWTGEDWTNVDVSLAVVSSLSNDALSKALPLVMLDSAVPTGNLSRSLPNMLT